MSSNDNIRLSSLSLHPNQNRSSSPSRSRSSFDSRSPRPSFDSSLHARATTQRGHSLVDVSDRHISDPPRLKKKDDRDSDDSDSDEEEEEEDDDDEDDSDEDTDSDTMSKSSRPAHLRPTDSHSGMPLLEKDDERERLGHGRGSGARSTTPLPAPTVSTPAGARALSRASTMRSQAPADQARAAARRKYIIAGIFLVVCLVSFVLQTELGRYVQHELGWNKAYCMLYLTHGSWALLWPAQLAILRLQKRKQPWTTFWRRHVEMLRTTAHMVAEQTLDVPRHVLQARSPVPYILRTTAVVTSCLTVAGLTWYVAVNMTTPSNLTAIYNCSAFFAYAFSVPLLKEKLRLDKALAVIVAIVGVLIVAYGDGTDDPNHDGAAATRFLGNLIIGAGSVLYGLYEVLYKRYACPPDGAPAAHGVIFANTFGSCIGAFTLLVLWIPLPILHILGWEVFELPTGKTAFYLWISVIMNATFAGSFLVLISLTSPVLSSVAALLTIFIVAIADWVITGEALSFSALTGGAMIVVAFLVLSWSTWREMNEEAEHKEAYGYAGVDADYDSEEEHLA
ncbi:hypothetical protein F4808DRAFT_365189 [Astrocystis sublimbata]|nr:hypothetical protein F4808DRAFT_95045 [Astrocystis sublimbata]KAI0192506.1 hypothetical protein F4808DRAFT_365189 [Astrocystis sublimbata]